ncbi:MAG: SDR family NAD(P)-dependent oxidoreductase [Dehalococcoidales bacterium]|nr:SDR family NAD(P)-dependent oxidoreductase [Dehalococcoidales bacterium]
MNFLEGKTAVITGSSKGLGRSFARGLAKEGARVVVNGTVAGDVNGVVEVIKSAGGTAVGCTESVSTMAGAQRIIEAALDAFGRLDILVNNAGNLRDRTFLKMTEEEWDSVISVHLKGTFACAKAAASVMSQQKSGNIINITSGAAWGPSIGQSNYAAAKGGIISLTYALANELARYNITANAVWPRALTRMTAPLLEGRLQRAREETKKLGMPEPSAVDIGWGPSDMAAPVVVFLASDEARNITGKILCLGGERLVVFSRNQKLASAIMAGGWTLEGIRKLCRLSLGKLLTAENQNPG